MRSEVSQSIENASGWRRSFRSGGIAWILLPLTVFAPAMTSVTGAQKREGPPAGYKTYYNVRFSYSVCYPEEFFAPQGESDNGDGQKFLSRDGAVMLVYGSNNALDQKLKDVQEEELRSYDKADSKVTYEVLRGTWFVVSGYKGGRTIYRKTILRHDQFKTLQIEYDAGKRTKYDEVVAKISKCFAG